MCFVLWENRNDVCNDPRSCLTLIFKPQHMFLFGLDPYFNPNICCSSSLAAPLSEVKFHYSLMWFDEPLCNAAMVKLTSLLDVNVIKL